MPFRADSVPREHEILCESCGYGLDGLPSSGLCPECGHPISESTVADGRVPPPWEDLALPFRLRFLRTTASVIRHPRGFYRTLPTRDDPRRSRGFAFLHHWIAAYLFSLATASHLLLFLRAGSLDLPSYAFFTLAGGAALSPLAFGAILGTRLLAGRLSSLEARYHGLRLPHGAVTRALHYHAAQLFPVAVGTVAITVGYPLLATAGLVPRTSDVPYLYTLCGWIVLAAVYLFQTYWKAMKAIMYANR